MEVTELKHDIQSNKLKQFYIFAGEEWKVQELYLQQMAKKFDSRVYVESVSDIFRRLTKASFIKQTCLYIVRDDKEFMTTETMQNSVFNLLHDNTLVLLVSSVDKRMKFFKTYNNSLIEFNTLEHAVLARYVKREIMLSDKNIDLLIELCENNYGRCLLEIDKIRCYCSMAEGDGYDMSWDESFELLLSKGVIYEPPYDAIFDFVDNVLRRNVNVAFDLLQQCYEVGEATLVMLSVLYTNAKQLLQVQSYKGSDISKSTGLTAWQIKCAKKRCNYYSVSELVCMLKLIRTVEKGIKTGRMEEEYAMQYLLANVL